MRWCERENAEAIRRSAPCPIDDTPATRHGTSRHRRTRVCSRHLPASAALPLPGAADTWRCYDFQCQELVTDSLAFSSSSWSASIGRAGASDIRRLITLISVGWVPPYLHPSGACLALGTRVYFSLLTPSRVTPNRGCVFSDARRKPSEFRVQERWVLWP